MVPSLVLLLKFSFVLFPFYFLLFLKYAKEHCNPRANNHPRQQKCIYFFWDYSVKSYGISKFSMLIFENNYHNYGKNSDTKEKIPDLIKKALIEFNQQGPLGKSYHTFHSYKE